MNILKRIGFFLFSKELKIDRFFLACLLFGLIVLPYTLFFSGLLKSDLIEIQATVSKYRINSEHHLRGGNLSDNFLELSLVEYPCWLRITTVDQGSEHNVIDLIDFKKTKIKFQISKSDLNKIKSNEDIRPYSLTTDTDHTIIDLDSSLIDHDYFIVSLKYLSILALIAGSVYFLTFKQSK
ncbi:MAG: hypothetical protein Q8928_04750 [Bacteroidota bacterium]|nr:hypothetical protein [Bacteroidota bacterium]